MQTAALKLHFFLLYAIVGAYLPYVPVFLGHDLKLPEYQIGWITGGYGLAVLLSPPLLSALADRRIPGRTLLACGYGLSCAALLVFSGVSGFVPALALSTAFGLCYTPLTPLLDGLAFTAMAQAQAAGRAAPAYGSLRIWGSLGFMAPAFVLFAVMHWGLAGGRAAMTTGAGAAALAFGCAWLLPRLAPARGGAEAGAGGAPGGAEAGAGGAPGGAETRAGGAGAGAETRMRGAEARAGGAETRAGGAETRAGAAARREGALGGAETRAGGAGAGAETRAGGAETRAGGAETRTTEARAVPTAAAWRELWRAPTRGLIGPLVLLFAAISVFYAFYPQQVVAVGIDPAWVGLVSNLGVAFELPWIVGAAALLRRFRVRSLFVLGAVCMTARMVLLALVPTAEVVVATQVLHGPVVLSLYVLPPMVLDRKATPDFRNSVQGLYAALCYGAARLVGSGLGGHAAEFGLAWAFVLAAAFAGVATLWLALAWRDSAVERALSGRG